MSNPGARMGLRRAPFAFTEHGALMAATVLNSPRAMEMSLYVVRAFVRMREVLAILEQQTAALALKHDALAANTSAQFKAVIDALRDLMAPPEPKKKHPIGFVTLKEK